MRRFTRMTALIVGLSMSGMASAALHDRGNGLIYDDVLDITWLQDASLGGNRAWDDAVAWADALVYQGFDDWRLPSISVSSGIPTGSAATAAVVDCSTATEVQCRDNELGYMYYYNLAPGAPPTALGTDLTGNQGLIQNIQSPHWSGTEYAPIPIFAWFFLFVSGGQDDFDKGSNYAAWAVRPGDVAAPVPALVGPVWLGLLGLGMGVLGFGVSRSRWSSMRG